MSNRIPLSQPDITYLEIDAAAAALQSGTLALGPRTAAFEQAVAARVDARHGIAVNSATSAIHLVLEAFGIGPGDEVITAAFAFPAVAAAILHVGATPVFVDCEARSLNIDVGGIDDCVTERTSAIIASHIFGNPVGIDAVASAAMHHELPLIEDAGEAIGSSLRGRAAGSFGRIAVFAFHSTTQITAGEGGVIVTDDEHLARRCRLGRNHGLSGDVSVRVDDLHEVRTDELMKSLGHGFRLSEIHAAIGEVQLSRLAEILQKRSAIAEWYTQRLGGQSDLMCPTIEPGVAMSWDGFVVRLSDRFEQSHRDEIIRGLHRHEIGAADYFQPVPHLSPIVDRLGDSGPYPVAESVSQRTIALPFFTTLSEREVDIVCQTLTLMMGRATFA